MHPFYFQFGAPPQAPSHPGYISRIGFWAGGFGAVPGTTPPSRTVGWVGRKKRYVDLKSNPRGFSRKYVEELLAADRALKRAEEADKSRKAREALDGAIEEASEALATATEMQLDDALPLKRMTLALDAAASARKVGKVIEEANKAIAAAMAVKILIQIAEDNEEEEAIMLLLLH